MSDYLLPTFIIGVDLALNKTGIGVLKVAGDKNGTIIDQSTDVIKVKSNVRGAPRLVYIYEQLNNILESIGNPSNIVVCLEDYSFGSFKGGNNASLLGEAGGVVRFKLCFENYTFMAMHPSAWKKLVIGTGKASKEQIVDYVHTHLGITLKTQDEYDALCIAHAAHKIIFGDKICESKSKFSYNTGMIKVERFEQHVN